MHPMRQRRHLADGDAGGVADGAEDGGGGGDQRRLADALGAVGAERLAVLDQQHSISGMSPKVGIR